MIERTLNLKIAGAGARMMMFAHGFGCDQNMWRLVAPAFKGDFRTILFDFVGAGRSDLGAYDVAKYASLDGYADDVVSAAQARSKALAVVCVKFCKRGGLGCRSSGLA